MASRKIKKVALKDLQGNLNIFNLDDYALNQDATLEQKGITQLQTIIDDNETRSATPKAVNTVKAIADKNAEDIGTIKESVGGDLANLAQVALINKANEFTQAQKVTIDGKTISIGSDSVTGEGAENDMLRLGVKDSSGIKAELTLENTGSIRRTELPVVTEDAPLNDLEVPTVKFVKDEVQKLQSGIDEFLKDATDTQKGVVVLSDATDADTNAATGKTAATPLAVKTVKAIADKNTQDLAALTEKVEQLEQLEQASNKGQKKLAYKDYTQTGNQTDMEVGVYYMVPFNKAGQYIAFDEETGRPSASQSEGVDDTKVKYCVIMYKAPGGTVSNLGQQDQEMDFDLFATLAGNNVFTGDNTFNKAPTKVAQSSNTQTLEDLADGVLISKKELVDYVKKQFSDASIQVVESDPEEGSMTAGVLYLVVEPTSEP